MHTVKSGLKELLNLAVIFSATILLFHFDGQTLRAQETWLRIAPAGESFTVLMPKSASAGTRRIPLGERDWIPGRVYYSLANNKRYLVLSLAKTSPDKFQELSSFEKFVAGIERAFKSTTNEITKNEITAFSTFDGGPLPAARPFKQYHVTLGQYSGIARLLDSEASCYALIVVGTDGNDSDVKRFLSSFVSGPKNTNSADVAEDWLRPDSNIQLKAELPPEPWPQPFPPINAGVLNGKAVNLPVQTYPHGSHDSGVVVIQVLVEEQGKVIAAEAINGPESLRASAVEAARKAGFKPMKLSGQPVKITGVLVYRFVSQG